MNESRRTFLALVAGLALTPKRSDAASGWERKGECNNCGYCCTVDGPFDIDGEVKHRYTKDPTIVQYAQFRGYTIDFARGTSSKSVLGYNPCSKHEPGVTLDGKSLPLRSPRDLRALTPGGRCRIYAQRPQFCRDYPSAPEEVVGSPCSYWFEASVDGKIIRRGGQASPFPA